MEGGGGGGHEDKEWRGKGSITSKTEETDNKEKVKRGKKKRTDTEERHLKRGCKAEGKTRIC